MEKEIKFRKLPPPWFIRVIDGFRASLLSLNRRIFPANVVLYEFFQYFWLLPCLRVAAELDIAGRLKLKPRSVEDLAAETKSDPEYLFRTLRALASQKIFRETPDGKFANTRLSRPLIEGPGSLRFMIMQHLGRLNWTVFADLPYSIEHGRDAFMKVHGKPIYDFLADNAEETTLFDNSMTNLTELAIEPLLSAYNFSRFNVIADIGGGQGLLLSSILHKYKDMKGILFDLPGGLKDAGPILDRFGVAGRTEVRAGDFFNEIPIADAYILKHIIHNWSDHDACRLLLNVRESMPEHARVLLVEMIIDEGNGPSFGKLIDIQMMAFMESGKERTRKEYEALLRQGGLKISRIVPTIAPFSIIEAVKED